jgi:hypothetical protein
MLRAHWYCMTAVAGMAAFGCSHSAAFVVNNQSDAPVLVSYEIPRWAFVEPTLSSGGPSLMGFYSVRTDSTVRYDLLRVGSDSSVRIMAIGVSPAIAQNHFAAATLVVTGASGSRRYHGSNVLRAFTRSTGSLRVLDIR